MPVNKGDKGGSKELRVLKMRSVSDSVGWRVFEKAQILN
jgi:hypothetical protein